VVTARRDRSRAVRDSRSRVLGDDSARVSGRLDRGIPREVCSGLASSAPHVVARRHRHRRENVPERDVAHAQRAASVPRTTSKAHAGGVEGQGEATSDAARRHVDGGRR